MDLFCLYKIFTYIDHFPNVVFPFAIFPLNHFGMHSIVLNAQLFHYHL